MMCQATAATSMHDESIFDGPEPVSHSQVLLHRLMIMGDRLIAENAVLKPRLSPV